MKTLKLLGSLVMPVLFAASCGGVGDLFGSDGGSSACPSDVTVYRVANGAYQTKNVSNLTETCNLGLTPSALMTQRSVANDTTTGSVTVSSQDGSTILGSGAVRCNSGTLTAGPTTLSTGPCQYSSQRSSVITITAENTFSLQYTETRSNFMSVQGQTCTQTAPCTIEFKLDMGK